MGALAFFRETDRWHDTSFEMAPILAGAGGDDTASFQTALATGKVIRLWPGKTYRVSSRIPIASKGGVIGDPTSLFLALSSGFTNTDPTNPTCFGDNAVVFDLSGELDLPYTPNEDQIMLGVRIQFQFVDGRNIAAIVARNVRNVRIEHCEIWGGSTGLLIRLDSLRGKCAVNDNYIHGFSFNQALTGRQTTGISWDSDRKVGDSDYGSLTCRGNKIVSLQFGATALAANSNIEQTDGINLCPTGTMNGGAHIVDNYIELVGEGIDNFSDYAVITGNIIRNARMAGLKIIHGASYCQVADNIVDGFGLMGMMFAGSSIKDVKCNSVHDNIFRRGDIYGTHAASGTTNAAINIGNGGAFNPIENDIHDNILEPGAANYALVMGALVWNNRATNNMCYAGDVGLVNASPGAVVLLKNASTGWRSLQDFATDLIGLRTPRAVLTLANGLNSDIPITRAYTIISSGPTAAFSVGGFLPSGAPDLNGLHFWLQNSTSFNMTIVNEDASSTTANRIRTLTGADVVHTSNSAAHFIYDASLGRWMLQAQNTG